MRFYLSTQSAQGHLISLALVREDGRSLYIVLPHDHHSTDPEAVAIMAVLKDTPESPVWPSSREIAAVGVNEFLTPSPVVVGPLHAITALVQLKGDLVSRLKSERVYDLPTRPRVPLNAWWEAVALAEVLGAELGG